MSPYPGTCRQCPFIPGGRRGPKSIYDFGWNLALLELRSSAKGARRIIRPELAAPERVVRISGTGISDRAIAEAAQSEVCHGVARFFSGFIAIDPCVG